MIQQCSKVCKLLFNHFSKCNKLYFYLMFFSPLIWPCLVHLLVRESASGNLKGENNTIYRVSRKTLAGYIDSEGNAQSPLFTCSECLSCVCLFTLSDLFANGFQNAVSRQKKNSEDKSWWVNWWD